MSNFYPKDDFRSIIYAIARVGLGVYLLVHAVYGLIDFDRFMISALSYLPEDSPISFLAYLTPIIPFMELFLALMIFLGIYTKSALQWALAIGVFFIGMFHFLGDLGSALEHCYSVIIKLSLLYGIFYNKYSLDYYNMWKVDKEVQSIEQRY